ncbi:MAG: hypothetical protein KF894_11810 [Labilithrix sp.]|nr:hypothetical protein [Labilithrix sp.]
MSRSHRERSWNAVRPFATPCCIAVALMLTACGGTTRRASTPHSQTTTTAAAVTPRVERLVVADRGAVSMVARGGCVASVRTAESEAGAHDELRVRCPKPERMKRWFDGADRVIATLALEPVDEDLEEEDDVKLPTAKLLTASGKALRVAKPEDVAKLASEVTALSAELAAAESVAPGPASADGWQMLHVMGPAQVLFAGTPARGVFEARVSTSGQYMCDFITNVEDEPMRATKSGWLTPQTASKAIDEVLGPFNATEAGETPKTTFAAGTKAGAEQRSNAISTAAVFERFSLMQDALGDACLPELEPPSTPPLGL